MMKKKWNKGSGQKVSQKHAILKEILTEESNWLYFFVH